MYFRNYAFRKTLLDKCLKSRVSEDPSTYYMENGIKKCRYLNDTDFTIFINNSESNRVQKRLS